MNICQSCSMPLREDKDMGTNADASLNHDYCRFCYKDGQFADEGITMAQKIDKMVGLARTMNIPEDKAREMATNILPTLKRWLVLLPLLALLLIPAAVSAMGTAPHLPGIVDLRGEIASELNSMDNDLSLAAQQLSTIGIHGSAAPVLQNIYNQHNSVVDVATIDPEGYLITIQPDRYKSSEGQRINEQPHFMEVTKTGRPVMSGIFKTVEGFYAASIVYPIANLKGQTIGYVSVVFKPDALMGSVIKQYKTSVEAFALQKDGRVIYDKDILQIGKMTFSDPAYQSYPDLLRLAAQITEEPSGAGTYTFPVGLSGAPTRKATEWTTISLHGVEWRLVVSKTL